MMGVHCNCLWMREWQLAESSGKIEIVIFYLAVKGIQ